MSIEEYLSTLTEQIRCTKARGMVQAEVRAHIEDQRDAFEAEGMSRDEALQEAVKEMGDPVSVGVSLDQIHRPKTAWGMILLVGIISVLSILAQFLIERQGLLKEPAFYIRRHIRNVLLGFAAMLLVYRLDYSILAKWGKKLAGLFLIFVFGCIFVFSSRINGATHFVYFFPFNFYIDMMMYLYIPLYGAILYQYRNESYKGLIKSVIWLILPCVLAFRIPAAGLALSLFLLMAVLLSVAVAKNWFGVKKGVVLGTIWGAILAVPMIVLPLAIHFHLLREYQIARLQAYTGNTSREMSYVQNRISQMFAHCRFMGSNLIKGENAGILPNENSDFLLIHLISYYGLLVGIIVIGVLIFLIVKMFHISIRQKNQLGMITGCGCSLVFAMLGVINLLENIGLFPNATTYLPFFSYGGTGTVVSYLLLGILLSIYRYKDILPTHQFNSPAAKKQILE